MAQILFVEDSADIQELVKFTLFNHNIVIVSTQAKAEQELRAKRFDMLILDVMLPDGNGFELCSALQLAQKEDLPIIFITSKTELSDKVLGFSLGADDYITKPFNPIEFRARVEARLKKIQLKSLKTTQIVKGDLSIDILSQKVSVMNGSEVKETLDLTQMEFKLLVYFAKHEEQVLTREQLLEAVWGDSIHVFDRTIDTHVSHLRKKLGNTQCTVRSVYGAGYRFVVAKQAATAAS